MSSQTPERAPAAAPTPDESRVALDRVLQSRTFERAPRLQDFLRFIGELTLRGESERINESLIAIEVFRRTAYSSGDDSAVRRQAHALRSKLQRYYADEGGQDPVRLDLPVGRYVPTFRRAEAAETRVPPPSGAEAAETRVPPPSGAEAPPAAGLPPPAPEAPATPVLARLAPDPADRSRRVATVALLGGGGLATLAGGFVWGRRSVRTSPAGSDLPAPLRTLWSGWLRPGGRVILCVSNPRTFLVKMVAQLPSPETEEGYPVSEQDEREYRKRMKIHGPGRMHLFPDPVSQAKQGELAAAVRLAAFFTQAGMHLDVRQSRLMSPDVFARENVIVLGHDENNPWVGELLTTYPVRLHPPTTTMRRHILDHRAEAGQTAAFANSHAQGDGGLLDEYGLISLLPGLGEGRRLALLSGLSSPASEMATDYLLDATRAQSLLAAVRAAGVPEGGPFQAVIRVRSRSKLPMQGEVVRVRGV